jgi:hypothetical protein
MKYMSAGSSTLDNDFLNFLTISICECTSSVSFVGNLRNFALPILCHQK